MRALERTRHVRPQTAIQAHERIHALLPLKVIRVKSEGIVQFQLTLLQHRRRVEQLAR